jgi:hypothetical protein
MIYSSWLWAKPAPRKSCKSVDYSLVGVRYLLQMQWCALVHQARTSTYDNLPGFPEAQTQNPMELLSFYIQVVRFARTKRDSPCICRGPRFISIDYRRTNP